MAVTRQVGAMTDAKPSVVDLTGKEFFLAKRSGAGFSLAALGEKVAGVISEGKPVGQHTSVDTGNQLKCVAAIAIAVDDELTAAADGKARPAAAGQFVFGRAISAAKAGELVEFDTMQEGIKA